MKKTSKLGSQLKGLLFAAFFVPVQSPTGWKALSFKKIPSNEVKHATDGLHIRVRKSAGPLIYRFDKPQTVKAIRVKGTVLGQLQLRGEQGEKGFDDSLLRFGLVVPGNKKLNFFQKQIAPKWVLELHALAPEGTGIDRIEFFCVASDAKKYGKKRTHPMSDLFRENFVWQLNAKSSPMQTALIPKATAPSDSRVFEFRQTLDRPLPVLAIWLAIDGDDTGSEFELQLSDIELQIAE